MTHPYALSDILAPEKLDENLYRGLSPQVGWQRVFGGQVVGQALAAAGNTVDGLLAHSLHGYFLRPGDPAVPIFYQVERIRDGRSFATRRVVAQQHGKQIFVMMVSCHAAEDGLSFAKPMPDVPPPDACPPDAGPHFLQQAPESVRLYFRRPKPIEFRVAATPVSGSGETSTAVWIRVPERLDPAPAFQQAVLAYLSDLSPLDAVLSLHGLSPFDAGLQVASLDHAVWFHRPLHAGDWHLFVQEPQFTGGGLGLSAGRVYNQAGALVATVAQEGLIRVSG